MSFITITDMTRFPRYQVGLCLGGIILLLCCSVIAFYARISVPCHVYEQPHVGDESQLVTVDEVLLYESGYRDMENPGFRRYLRSRWLIGPPKKTFASRNGQTPVKDISQVGQSNFIDRMLQKRKNGFFIECGAANGQTLSNTLFFEKNRNWTGLLIEANPKFFQSLLSRRRNVYALNAALSTKSDTTNVTFTPLELVGGISDKMDATHMKYVNKHPTGKITVTCFPLYGVLYAIGVNHVDYFSLDVEGPELEILGTLPFEKLTIDVLSVEYRVSDMKSIDVKNSLIKLEKIRDFFKNIGGYKELGILPWNTKTGNKTEGESGGLDVIFGRKSFFLD